MAPSWYLRWLWNFQNNVTTWIAWSLFAVWWIYLTLIGWELVTYWCAKHPRGALHQRTGWRTALVAWIPASVASKVLLVALACGSMEDYGRRLARFLPHLADFDGALRLLSYLSLGPGWWRIVVGHGPALLTCWSVAALAAAVGFHIHGRLHPRGWLRRVPWRPWIWWPGLALWGFLELAGVYGWIGVLARGPDFLRTLSGGMWISAW